MTAFGRCVRNELAAADKRARRARRPCTWVECGQTASKAQIAKDGQQWADLCPAHDQQLVEAIASGPKELLSAWVKAQGGAAKAAGRMTGVGKLQR